MICANFHNVEALFSIRFSAFVGAVEKPEDDRQSRALALTANTSC